ncbi:MAG: L-aspartate oxidase [Paracidovorax wautersii]|uniref:L-aspartate oxidase n=1 Tax=Paracidovorax wautersii TaxID=1177982 RepID=A0A7V8FLM8_9BURK|nr:MAG: L-aspartate oxidase [Paracidovorax wautersii]
MSALPAAHDAVYDVLVIGAGLAGLSTALSLPPTLRVAVLSKQDLALCASEQAQGGIAAALAPGDSVAQHAHDTEVAGAGLCDGPAVNELLAQAPAAVAWLRQHGVAFTSEAGTLHLTREGGHGQRRIVHAADATGAAICAALRPALAACPQVEVLTHHAALDLLTEPDGAQGRRCVGARVLDSGTGTLRRLWAKHTVLATGGLGQLYACTTNPASATGDGIALAWRAGCRVANLEFIQFHPTALHLPGAPTFLITEAARGEGGVLRRPDGMRFMPVHDARAELAPRDIVARAIALEMAEHGLPFVLLDLSHQPADFIEQHFPTIRARCAQWGIDITREPIPVAPAAHYACGGIVADTAGRTDLPGLFAVGETACTGLHGANRLASNSLLECVVMGRAAAQAIGASPSMPTRRADLPPDEPSPSAVPAQPRSTRPRRAGTADGAARGHRPQRYGPAACARADRRLAPGPAGR